MLVTRLNYTTLAILLLTGMSQVKSANILGYFGTPSYSHQIIFQPIIRALAQKGHSLTVITTDPIGDKTLTTLDEIDLHDVSYDIWNKFNISSYGANGEVGTLDLRPILRAHIAVADEQLSHPRVKSLINESHKYHFDLVLFEYPHFTSLPFKRVYNTSLIAILSMPLHLTMGRYVGNPEHPILYLDQNQPYGKHLTTFWQKFHSFIIFSVGVRVGMEQFILAFYEVCEKHFGWKLVSQFEDLMYSVDLVMVNNNPILNTPRPNVPAVIEFTGIHMQPPKKLPEDIKYFLDSALHGAIYFSLGSNIKSSSLPLNKQEMILKGLAALPYQVLWKYESALANLPKNIKIIEWAPQQDVLRHPKVKLFITQGGLQSLDEAIYTKTPVLVIPFFGDQLGNAARVEQVGIGKGLHFASLTKETLRESILSIINNDQYTARIEEVYKILNDQPMTAINKTVWWIEYVLRHKGARHLRSPSVDATFIDYYMIDVIGFLLIVAFFVLLVIHFIVKFIIKKVVRIIFLFNGNEVLKANKIK